MKPDDPVDNMGWAASLASPQPGSQLDDLCSVRGENQENTATYEPHDYPA